MMTGDDWGVTPLLGNLHKGFSRLESPSCDQNMSFPFFFPGPNAVALLLQNPTKRNPDILLLKKWNYLSSLNPSWIDCSTILQTLWQSNIAIEHGHWVRWFTHKKTDNFPYLCLFTRGNTYSYKYNQLASRMILQLEEATLGTISNQNCWQFARASLQPPVFLCGYCYICRGHTLLVMVHSGSY